MRDGLADGVVDLVAEVGHVFNAGAGVRANVNLELAGVNGGKEILAQEGIENGSGGNGEDDEQDEKDRGMSETELQNAMVTAAELLEVVLETKLEADQGIAAGLFSVVSFVVMFLQKVFRHSRNDGARQEVGGEHGEADGFGERHEEIARDAAQEKHRHEDDADGDGRDQRGYGDLRRAVEDGLLNGLTLLEVTIDVLDFDGGVVDENTYGEGQAAEGHDVDGFAEGAEHEQRRENRERNGNRDDDCAAPAAEKDQDHHSSQAGGNDGLTHDTADRCTDENGLVAERRDLERGRKLALELVDLGTQALDDVQR